MANNSNHLEWNGQAFFLLAPFFFWGTAMVAMKGVIPHTTPFFMAGVRLVPAGLLLLLAAAIAKRPQPQTLKAWLWIGLFALVDGALFQGFLASGLVKTGAGLGSVAIDSQPLVVAVLSWLLFGEFIGFWGWLGLATGLIGISAIGLPDEWFLAALNLDFVATSVNIDRVFQQGEWLMLLAALSMAIGTVMMPKVSEYADPVVATGWHMILGGLPLFGISAAIESQPWQQLAPTDWLALSYATVFGSAVAYGLFFYFAARGNLTSLSSLTFFTPIFALLFGYVFLGEVLTPVQWVGASVTLVSVYLIERRDRLPCFSDWRKSQPATESASVLEGSRVPASKASSEDSESKVLRS
ncbi:DMT family transporter [Baaleninema sp.]|uniref:DMT family transporter n=1 Tax=Baaleninema sp. TaxID=3101197 RepID=UPI003D028140